MLNLTSKERSLLEDQKKHEIVCIKKYNDYANQAQDPQLKQLFQTHAQHEEQHLNTINQILSGQLPNMSQQQNQQQQNQQSGNMGQQVQQFLQSAAANSSDAFLCSDLLMAEQYVSRAYDATIFEIADTNVRQLLNHIQKEEQQHGADLSNYLRSHGLS